MGRVWIGDPVMALAFLHAGKLYIVLDEENVERIQKYDPFELLETTGLVGAIHMPPQVVIAYAKKEEHAKIAAMASGAEVVAYLNRGYTITGSGRERTTPLSPLKDPRS